MLAALKVMGRQNVVGNPRLLGQYITDVTDDQDDTKDSFVAMVNGQANDRLVDTVANKTFYTDNSAFTEYGPFVRSGNTGLRDTIPKATADVYALHTPLQT